MVLSRSSSLFSYIDDDGKEVFEISDDDDDDAANTTFKPSNPTGASSPLFRTLNLGASLDDDDDELTQNDDDDAFPEWDELVVQSQRSARSETETIDIPDSDDDLDFTMSQSSAASRKRKADDELSPRSPSPASPPPAKKSRARKDPEQARLDKEAKKAETERKKAEKAAEKARKAQEKATLALDKQLNKLVTDKKSTLPDITLEIHPSLCTPSAPFRTHVRALVDTITDACGTPERMADPWPVHPRHFDDVPALGGVRDLIRWRRRNVTATFDEKSRRWVGVEAHERVEGVYMLYVTLGEVVRQHSSQSLPSQSPTTQLETSLTTLRTVLGPHRQLWLLVDASQSKSTSKSTQADEWLNELQITYDLHVVHARTSESVVLWLYNVSADIGIKQHKLVERSHLPFCPVVKKHSSSSSSSEKTGKHKETFVQILEQIHRVQPYTAREIGKQRGFGSLRQIFETYNTGGGGGGGGARRLVGVPDGAGKGRNVGQTISARIHTVFTSEDSLVLIGNDGGKNE